MSGNYDVRPEVETYTIPSVAFGNSVKTYAFIGPAGRRGLVVDIMMDITADCVGTTSVPEAVVGLTSGSTEYARFRLGTTAILGYLASDGVRRASQIIRTKGIPQVPPPVATDFTAHVALEKAFIPADTAFLVTLVAGVGGSPAGTGITYVTIKWF